MNAKGLTVFYKLLNLYEKSGKAQYTIGEPLTILEHSIECARFQLKTNNSSAIVSALLHDIGHLAPVIPIDPNTGIDDQHERVGANMLAEMGFNEDVFIPVRNHVNAKRYLCYKKVGYYEGLSAGSIASLKIQGGIMHKEEAELFEKSKWFTESINLRYADEAAKTTSDPPMRFLDFKEYILNVM